MFVGRGEGGGLILSCYAIEDLKKKVALMHGWKNWWINQYLCKTEWIGYWMYL